MNTKQVGVWAFIIGLVLAMAGVFFDLGAWGRPVMIVLGILVGVFHPIRKDVVALGVVYLTTVAAAAAMDAACVSGLDGNRPASPTRLAPNCSGATKARSDSAGATLTASTSCS